MTYEKEITRAALVEAVKELTFLREKLYGMGEKTLYTTNGTINLIQDALDITKEPADETVH